MCRTTTSKEETWSRGTNLRLPFVVNVMLNLSLTLASDHHQFSPNNVHTSSREQFMRTDKMITKGKISYDFLIKFSHYRKYLETSLGFICGYLGLTNPCFRECALFRWFRRFPKFTSETQ